MHVPRGDTDTTLQDVGVAWEGRKGKEGRKEERREGGKEGRKQGTCVVAHVSFEKLKADVAEKPNMALELPTT